MDMDESLERFRNAVDILVTGDAVLKVRLAAAGQEFWSGTFDYEDWPRHLQEQADGITHRILEKGTVEATVRQMDRNAAQETSRSILKLMVDFEIAKHEAAKSQRGTPGG